MINNCVTHLLKVYKTNSKFLIFKHGWKLWSLAKVKALLYGAPAKSFDRELSVSNPGGAELQILAGGRRESRIVLCGGKPSPLDAQQQPLLSRKQLSSRQLVASSSRVTLALLRQYKKCTF